MVEVRTNEGNGGRRERKEGQEEQRVLEDRADVGKRGRRSRSKWRETEVGMNGGRRQMKDRSVGRV